MVTVRKCARPSIGAIPGPAPCRREARRDPTAPPASRRDPTDRDHSRPPRSDHVTLIRLKPIDDVAERRIDLRSQRVSPAGRVSEHQPSDVIQEGAEKVVGVHTEPPRPTCRLRLPTEKTLADREVRQCDMATKGETQLVSHIHEPPTLVHQETPMTRHMHRMRDIRQERIVAHRTERVPRSRRDLRHTPLRYETCPRKCDPTTEQQPQKRLRVRSQAQRTAQSPNEPKQPIPRHHRGQIDARSGVILRAHSGRLRFSLVS